jgi:hypothetical protein
MTQVNKVLNLDIDTRQQIDRLLIQGKSRRSIALQYGVSEDSLARYEQNHLSGRLVAAAGRRDHRHLQKVLVEVDQLLLTSKDILEDALSQGHNTLALKAIKEVRNNLEILAKVETAISQQMQAQAQIIEVEEGKHSHITDEWHKAFRKLPAAEQEAYRATTIKCFAMIGSISENVQTDEEDLGEDPTPVDPVPPIRRKRPK